MSVISDGGQRQPDEKPDLLHAQLAAGSPVLLALSGVHLYCTLERIVLGISH